MDLKIYREGDTENLAVVFVDTKGKMMMFWPMMGRTEAEAREIACAWLNKENARLKKIKAKEPTAEQMPMDTPVLITGTESEEARAEREERETENAEKVEEAAALTLTIPQPPLYVTTTERREAVEQYLAEQTALKSKMPWEP